MRRIDHRDVVVNCFRRQRARRGPGQSVPAPAPRSASTGSRCWARAARARCGSNADAFASPATWREFAYRWRSCSPRTRPRGSGTSRSRTSARRARRWISSTRRTSALAPYGAVRLNEYYVSQYVDHTPLQHPRAASCSRCGRTGRRRPPSVARARIAAARATASRPTRSSSMVWPPVRRRRPPALQAARCRASGASTSTRWPCCRTRRCSLAPGARARAASSRGSSPIIRRASAAADLAFVDRALALPEAAAPDAARAAPSPARPTLFSARPLLAVADLDAAELATHFGERSPRRARGDGRLLSFFGADGARHVVLPRRSARAAPARADPAHRRQARARRRRRSRRPCGWPASSTRWSRRATSASTASCRPTQLSRAVPLARASASSSSARTAWQLLDVPSAFEMSPSGCRWLYRHAGGCSRCAAGRRCDGTSCARRSRVAGRAVPLPGVEPRGARTATTGRTPCPRVAARRAGRRVGAPPDSDVGPPLSGRRLPHRSGARHGDRAASAATSCCSPTAAARSALRRARSPRRRRRSGCASRAARRSGTGAAPAQPATRRRCSRGSALLARHDRAGAAGAAVGGRSRLAAILPWFAHDALIHYLAPRGLEQYSGGGWGTRDVCQGPVELLLSLGHCAGARPAAARLPQPERGRRLAAVVHVLRARAQHPPRRLARRHRLLAACSRWRSTCSRPATRVLDESLPFFHRQGDARAEHASVLAHVERALALIDQRVIPGTRLAAYGHGDWNDSLQPADPACASGCAAPGR